jgi:hypothetical protein
MPQPGNLFDRLIDHQAKLRAIPPFEANEKGRNAAVSSPTSPKITSLFDRIKVEPKQASPPKVRGECIKERRG